MAFGAPCFFAALGEGDSSGSGVTVGEGVSDGSGDGELFFFRCGELVGEGIDEAFFFFGLGDRDSDSSSVDGVAVGCGDSFTRGVADFSAVGADVDDFLLLAVFRFRGFGVGVGVAKIFWILSLNGCSAHAGASWASRIARTTMIRSNMENNWTVRRGNFLKPISALLRTDSNTFVSRSAQNTLIIFLS
ncbi:MAG TPA: hypothetical protein VEH26_00485 [Chthoniobacterales bacterium]|nr:hypothetical protein [Chthoniobacterales bacterium]